MPFSHRRFSVSPLIAIICAAVATALLVVGTAAATNPLRLQVVTKTANGPVNPTYSFAQTGCPTGYKLIGGGGGGQSTAGGVPVMSSSGPFKTSHWGVAVQNQITSGSVQAYAKAICARLG